MSSILKSYQRVAKAAGYFGQETNKAMKWWAELVAKLPVNRRRLLSDSEVEIRNKFLPGRMFAFVYDPKTKEELSYYDRFPLVILVEPAMTKAGKMNGFYGINLHYLAPKTRAQLLSSLMDVRNNKKMDETTRIRITYSLLKKAAKFRYFRPCFKQYLPVHVKSNMVEVPAEHWITACFLPVEHFAKSSKQKVWADSMRTING